MHLYDTRVLAWPADTELGPGTESLERKARANIVISLFRNLGLRRVGKVLSALDGPATSQYCTSPSDRPLQTNAGSEPIHYGCSSRFPDPLRYRKRDRK